VLEDVGWQHAGQLSFVPERRRSPIQRQAFVAWQYKICRAAGPLAILRSDKELSRTGTYRYFVTKRYPNDG
jgi:hypothetical protein